MMQMGTFHQMVFTIPHDPEKLDYSSIFRNYCLFKFCSIIKTSYNMTLMDH